jgi:multimeric flavodoxin WrbA
MKIIAINGSPRKDWNIATLLNEALEGAASQGAENELIHLYDLNYKGCISCFACKTKGGKKSMVSAQYWMIWQQSSKKWRNRMLLF